jgi:hypothetical protein
VGNADQNVATVSMQQSISTNMSASKIPKNDRSLNPSRFEKQPQFAADISLCHIFR